MKTPVETGLNKLFDFRGQTIDVSDQNFFTLKASYLRDEGGNKYNVSDPITADQWQLGRFVVNDNGPPIPG